MHATTHKTLRDLRRQATQVAAVAVTVMLGVALYIASAGAFRNLSTSYAYTYQRLHFADLVATGGNPESVAAAARSAGAARVATRTVLDPPIQVAGTKLIGRVIGLPDATRSTVDDVDVRAGSYLDPTTPDGVLVERHTADTFHLAVGDRLQVYAADAWHPVTVRGIVVSAEYLWPARSRQEALGDPHSFAVLFAGQSTVAGWAGTGANETLATLPARAPDGLSVRVAAALREAGAIDVTTRAEQPSNATLGEDLAGFNEMSVAFPLLFLTAAAVAAYVLLARRVLAERPIIGTLMACGARRGRLVRHYLTHGLLVGLAGAVAGVLLGVLTTGAVTRGYTAALGIPDTIVDRHPDLAALGLTFGALVGLAGAAAPAIAAARTAPAEAMRNTMASRPPGTWSRLVARLVRLPVSVRMALRDVARSRRRTTATMLGTVLALILVLASVGMLTSLSSAMHRYTQTQRQDATVTTAANGDTTTELRAVNGVGAIEPATVGTVTAAAGRYRYTTTLTELSTATTMHRFRDIHGGWTQLPADGVLAGASLADTLHVAVGDTITLTNERGAVPVRLAGLLNEPMGTTIYAPAGLATGVLPDTSTTTWLLRFAPDTNRDAMRQRITGLPGVLAYSDSRAVTASINQYLALMWTFIGVMILLGAVLAFTVIYVTMAVNVVERTNELATLRTAGVPVRRVAGTIASENLLATALGLPAGLLLGVLAARALLASFNSDLFHLDLDLGSWALPAATLGVLLAAALSQWPAVHAVRRLDIARVVRERAT